MVIPYYNLDQIPIKNIENNNYYIQQKNNNYSLNYDYGIDYSTKNATNCNCDIVIMFTKKEVIVNIKKNFEDLWQPQDQDNLYLRISNRLQDLLDIEFLDEEDITPKYDSFINFFIFLKNYNSINRFKYAITMTDNGEMTITSDAFEQIFFKIRFIDKTNISYHILNKTGKDYYNPKGTTEEFKKRLKEFYEQYS